MACRLKEMPYLDSVAIVGTVSTSSLLPIFSVVSSIITIASTTVAISFVGASLAPTVAHRAPAITPVANV